MFHFQTCPLIKLLTLLSAETDEISFECVESCLKLQFKAWFENTLAHPESFIASFNDTIFKLQNWLICITCEFNAIYRMGLIAMDSFTNTIGTTESIGPIKLK